MVEVNQLAIVNFIGLDKNPDTGMYTVYYHIINPSGIATQKRRGSILLYIRIVSSPRPLERFMIKCSTRFQDGLF